LEFLEWKAAVFIQVAEVPSIKTGGIIYGSDAPAGLRNTSIYGTDSPRTWPVSHGHAVCVAVTGPVFHFRNDTVKEDDNLSHTGAARADGNFFFGKGEKWDNSKKAFWRSLSAIIAFALAFSIIIFIVIWKITFRKRIEEAIRKNPAPEIDLDDLNLSSREIEICQLLLTDLSLKQVALKLGISYSGVSYHTQNIYRKLNMQSRTELLARFVERN